jgi:hypothetical protein
LSYLFNSYYSIYTENIHLWLKSPNSIFFIFYTLSDKNQLVTIVIILSAKQSNSDSIALIMITTKTIFLNQSTKQTTQMEHTRVFHSTKYTAIIHNTTCLNTDAVNYILKPNTQTAKTHGKSYLLCFVNWELSIPCDGSNFWDPTPRYHNESQIKINILCIYIAISETFRLKHHRDSIISHPTRDVGWNI